MSSLDSLSRTLSERIFLNTSYQLENRYTGQVYDLSKPVKPSFDVKMKSRYNYWNYTNGVLYLALNNLGASLKDSTYIQYLDDNFTFIFDHADLFKQIFDEAGDQRNKVNLNNLFRMDMLDFCGTMGAALIEVYEVYPKPIYKEYIDLIADYISNGEHRLNDGTLCRLEPRAMTVWADDLYMSISFLSRMGALTGEQKYFDDAAKQVVNYSKLMLHPDKKVYYHCYYDDLKQVGVAHWGRANGWSMIAQVELLKVLPKDHPQRAELLSILEQFIIGVSRLQTANGMWRQILDKPDSYLETSCTAMFSAGIAAAVRHGWIDKQYADVALAGWKGVESNITKERDIENICVGTATSPTLTYYYNRPVQTNNNHGTATVIYALAEMINLNAFLK